MTTVEVLYAYTKHPSEDAMRALGSVREVYGIRRILFDESAQTIRVEYDATRLNEPTIAALLRRAGLFLGERISLIPPQPPAPAVEAPPAAPAQK